MTRAALAERALRILSDAQQLADDLRAARDAAPVGEKADYRYPLRNVEHAIALLRKAGL